MNNKPILNHFFLLLAAINVSLVGCASPLVRSDSITPEESIMEPAIAEPAAPPKVDFKPETENRPKPVLGNNLTQARQFSYYTNADWSITVVKNETNSSESLTYYACDQGRKNCLSITNGQEVCSGDICTLNWQNGNYSYLLTESGTSKKLRVYEGEKIILNSAELQKTEPEAYKPQDNLIPNDREAVAGISEQELQKLLVNIQQIVLTEDWQALSQLSADHVTIKFPDQEKTIQIPKSELAATLEKQNLDQWKIRVITQTLEDLFLNQYGAMMGQGSIWIGKAEEQPAKIITINIW